MLVESDADLIKMFDIHSSRKINIYVDTMSSTNAILLVTSSNPNPLGTADGNEPVTVSSETIEDEGSDIDDVYGFTSKDKVAIENLGGSKFHDFIHGVNLEVHSGDGLSDFESDVGSLSPTIIPFIARAKTSEKAWLILANTYAKPSRGRIKQIKNQIKNLTKGSQSVTDFLQSVKGRANELAILRAPMDEDNLTDKILDGLGDDYKEVILCSSSP
ncbi:hypothetical protein F0562_003850 [Nyssa sinensis]|uniref:Uncharacterized protein n=1 Tax=Nyssa sinensis TaxID=561372 RepID=A0A5J5BXE2_9ASTE|nr:hypothetical protein F0562_003850 [Nyssa sinensis]